jgi:hypothetical protein
VIRRRELLAGWWVATLRAFTPGRFLAGTAPIAGTGLLAGGCAHLLQDGPGSNDALDQQEEDGWDVGSEGQALSFPHAVDHDVDGGSSWRANFGTLPLQLAPRTPRWLHHYDPTLFQSLLAPGNADLQLMMRPIASPEMAVALARGQSLLSLFVDESGCRNDVALVVDLPGPESIALAAALASCFDPVFIFDNWPHPAGVVPSHLTLGAALYYTPIFDRARVLSPPGAAPVFVLDRRRLSHYSDDADAFDNRYVVGLPPRHVFAEAGIRHVLYVTPHDQQLTYESDDLNDDLVALDRGGIDVKVLAMTDFSETPLPGWLDDVDIEAEPAPDAGIAADAGTDPDAGTGPDAGAPTHTALGRRFYFGGSRRSHRCFWPWYGWSRSPGPFVGPPPPRVPPRLAPRTTFRVSPRSPFSPRFRGRSSWWGRGGSMGRTHWGGSSG